MTRKDAKITTSLSQDFQYYISYPGNMGSQASGAYIFRPLNESSRYNVDNGLIEVQVSQGAAVTEVRSLVGGT